MKTKFLFLLAALCSLLTPFSLVAQDMPRPATPPASTVGSSSLYAQWWKYALSLEAKNSQQASDLAALRAQLTNAAMFQSIMDKLTDVEALIQTANVSVSVINGVTSGTLTWDFAGTGQTGFRIERSADGINFATLANCSDPAQRAYTDSPLSSGTFYWRVRALYPNAVSDPTNAASATIP